MQRDQGAKIARSVVFVAFLAAKRCLNWSWIAPYWSILIVNFSISDVNWHVFLSVLSLSSTLCQSLTWIYGEPELGNHFGWLYQSMYAGAITKASMQACPAWIVIMWLFSFEVLLIRSSILACSVVWFGPLPMLFKLSVLQLPVMPAPYPFWRVNLHLIDLDDLNALCYDDYCCGLVLPHGVLWNFIRRFSRVLSSHISNPMDYVSGPSFVLKWRTIWSTISISGVTCVMWCLWYVSCRLGHFIFCLLGVDESHQVSCNDYSTVGALSVCAYVVDCSPGGAKLGRGAGVAPSLDTAFSILFFQL